MQLMQMKIVYDFFYYILSVNHIIKIDSITEDTFTMDVKQYNFACILNNSLAVTLI